MTQEISALMDGELEPQEAERAIRACCASSEAADKWEEYNLIGDVLRGNLPHPTRTAQRVRDALAAEPAIISRPKRVYETTVGRIALAAAASVATVGVVGWMGSQQGGQSSSGSLVAKSPGTSNIQPVGNVVPLASTVDMQDYVAAHKQLPSAQLYRPVVNNRAAPAAAAR
ncbi:MAG: sigma-E factor negative regulatory protein [Usitatibacter sp.]